MTIRKPPRKRLNIAVELSASRDLTSWIALVSAGVASIVGCSLTLLYFLASSTLGSTISAGPGSTSAT